MRLLLPVDMCAVDLNFMIGAGGWKQKERKKNERIRKRKGEKKRNEIERQKKHERSSKIDILRIVCQVNMSENL